MGYYAGTAGETKYVICNADEGDPGAYMDRSILEGNPHGVLEGMLIGAYAIGSREGYIYVRAEYPLALRNVCTAMEQAEQAGLLGNDILGRDFSFQVRVSRGAGAFICGEETALIASLEGRSGDTVGQTTLSGPAGPVGQAYEHQQRGDVGERAVDRRARGRLVRRHRDREEQGYEGLLAGGQDQQHRVWSKFPWASRLRDIVFKIGGGVPKERALKAVQTGGPSGGVIPAQSAGSAGGFRRPDSGRRR